MQERLCTDVPEQRVRPPSRGLLRPGRNLWARALPWGVVLALGLWGTYKFARGVGIGLGLGGTGIPTASGALAALALYVLGARLIERRKPDELALGRLAPELAAGLVLGAVLFSAMMAALLAAGAYALTGPTSARKERRSFPCPRAWWIDRGAIFRLLWSG